MFQLCPLEPFRIAHFCHLFHVLGSFNITHFCHLSPILGSFSIVHFCHLSLVLGFFSIAHFCHLSLVVGSFSIICNYHLSHVLGSFNIIHLCLVVNLVSWKHPPFLDFTTLIMKIIGASLSFLAFYAIIVVCTCTCSGPFCSPVPISFLVLQPNVHIVAHMPSSPQIILVLIGFWFFGWYHSHNVIFRTCQQKKMLEVDFPRCTPWRT